MANHRMMLTMTKAATATIIQIWQIISQIRGKVFGPMRGPRSAIIDLSLRRMCEIRCAKWFYDWCGGHWRGSVCLGFVLGEPPVIDLLDGIECGYLE